MNVTRCLFVILIALVPRIATAEVWQWVGNQSDCFQGGQTASFFDPNQWDLSEPPGFPQPGDHAIFDDDLFTLPNATRQIVLYEFTQNISPPCNPVSFSSGDVFIGSAEVIRGDFEIDLGGRYFVLSSSDTSAGLVVGLNAQASLEITGGGSFFAPLIGIGGFDGDSSARGILQVRGGSGGDETHLNVESMYIGGDASGRVSFLGGSVTDAEIILVQEDGELRMANSDGYFGLLKVLNGGHLETASGTSILADSLHVDTTGTADIVSTNIALTAVLDVYGGTLNSDSSSIEVDTVLVGAADTPGTVEITDSSQLHAQYLFANPGGNVLVQSPQSEIVVAGVGYTSGFYESQVLVAQGAQYSNVGTLYSSGSIISVEGAGSTLASMAAELVENTTINVDSSAELQVSSDLWLVDSHAMLQTAGVLHFGGSFQLTNSAVEVSDGGSRIEGSVLHVSESAVSLTDSASLSVANLNLFSGKLTVLNGATAELTDGFILMGSWADDGPQPAELTIRDEGSQLTSVGQLLAGRLDSQNETHVVVASGGRLITGPGVSLTALSGVIAADPEMPAEVLVTGLGSAWTQTGHLSVGHRGQGLLRVEDAGFVQSVDAFVGRQSSANGRVKLDRKEGTSSGPGGTWQVDRNLWIGGTDAEAGGVGQIDVGSGSTLNVGGRLHLWRGAAVSVHDGGRIGIGVTPEFQANAIVLTTGGTLSGTGQINGSIAATAGTIEPGDPLGTLIIDGSLELGEDVSLLYQIGGTALDRVDRIDVTEAIDFGGQLVVSLVDGFEPDAGDTFTLMTYGSRQGSFLDSQLPELPGSLNWLLDIGPTTLRLSVVPASTSGDVNLDGLVNRADVALIAVHFGQSNGSTLATGDLDGDSAITLKDLAILQRNLTSSGSPNAPMSSAAVPEPSGICLMGIAVVSGMLRFRRHARAQRLATL